MTKFAQAVSREDILQTRKNNSEAWLDNYTMEQYLDRDMRLENSHKDNGLQFRTWKLEDDEGTIVSACETLQRSAYRKAKGEEGKEVPEFVVASVFTPSVHRCKGYAGELLTDVTAEHKKDGIVTLWSDVGNYYAKFGYKLADCDQFFAKPVKTTAQGVTLIDQDRAISELLPKHISQVKSTVDKLVEADGKTRFAVVPHRGMYEQLYIRADHHRTSMNEPPVTSYGAVTKNAWAAWVPFFGSKAVYIFGMDGPADELVQLFKAALNEAEAYGINVKLFRETLSDPEAFAAELKKANVDFEFGERKDSWPMFVAPEDCEWVCTGKYGWF